MNECKAQIKGEPKS